MKWTKCNTSLLIYENMQSKLSFKNACFRYIQLKEPLILDDKIIITFPLSLKLTFGHPKQPWLLRFLLLQEVRVKRPHWKSMLTHSILL